MYMWNLFLLWFDIPVWGKSSLFPTTLVVAPSDPKSEPHPPSRGPPEISDSHTHWSRARVEEGLNMHKYLSGFFFAKLPISDRDMLKEQEKEVKSELRNLLKSYTSKSEQSQVK